MFIKRNMTLLVVTLQSIADLWENPDNIVNVFSSKVLLHVPEGSVRQV